MRMDLKKPCKHCPFADSAHRIRFSCEERAEEIAENAYRSGFPCHKSADYREDEEGEGGFYAHDAGQHCIGSIMLFLNSGYENWPGIGNRDLPDRTRERLCPHLALVFESEDDFIAANASRFFHKPQHPAPAEPTTVTQNPFHTPRERSGFHRPV